MTLLDYALISLADCKAALGITTSDKDDRITFLINGFTDYIEKKCGRRFKQTTYTGATAEVVSAGHFDIRKSLFLRAYPITGSVSLEWNSSGDNTASWESVDSDNFFVDANSGILESVGLFHRGSQNYRATYTGGYATIPADIQMAVVSAVGESLNRGQNQGIKSESLGDHSVTFDTDTIAQETGLFKKIISSYKRYDLSYGGV